MSKHALCSPSGASKWMSCAASLAMEIGEPDDSSEFARSGTADHLLAAECLEAGKDCSSYIGQVIEVEGQEFEVDQERAETVQLYLDAVRHYAQGAQLMVEVALDLEPITGEKGAVGTSDAVVVANRGDELIVIDLKGGSGVEVEVENNKQLRIYALAALEQFAMLGSFKRVRTVIHQPRVKTEPSEWVYELDDEWDKFKAEVMIAAQRALQIYESALPFRFEIPPYGAFFPSEDTCRWCKAKHNCPALGASVQNALALDFESIANPELEKTIDVSEPLVDNALLGQKFASIGFIEDWASAVRAEIERRMFAGQVIPDPAGGELKIVQGRKGAKAWDDEQAIIKELKRRRVNPRKYMVTKLISPTAAQAVFNKRGEKDLRKRKGHSPEQFSPTWMTLSQHILQQPGKPTVARADDNRPAIDVVPSASDFEPINPADGLI